MSTTATGSIIPDDEGFRVIWGGCLTSPAFNSEGAAKAYLSQLHGGRKPEFSEGFGPEARPQTIRRLRRQPKSAEG